MGRKARPTTEIGPLIWPLQLDSGGPRCVWRFGCQNRGVRFERGHPPSKRVVGIIVGLVIISQALALIGDLFLAGFVDRHPAVLIGLNPRNRNLALATTQLDAVTYYTIGFARLVASDPLYYLLGFWYGERALSWVERRSRTYGPLVRDGEDWFRRLSYPLIFALPNNVICALSASTGVRLRTFIALNLSGTVFRLILIRRIGEVFQSPLRRIIDFIADNRVPVFILSAILVAWTIFGEFRGNNSELKGLTSLTDDEADDGTEDASREAGGDDGAVESEAGSGTGTGEVGPETDPR